jgi:hypothetical protein
LGALFSGLGSQLERVTLPAHSSSPGSEDPGANVTNLSEPDLEGGAGGEFSNLFSAVGAGWDSGDFSTPLTVDFEGSSFRRELFSEFGMTKADIEAIMEGAVTGSADPDESVNFFDSIFRLGSMETEFKLADFGLRFAPSFSCLLKTNRPATKIIKDKIGREIKLWFLQDLILDKRPVKFALNTNSD